MSKKISMGTAHPTGYGLKGVSKVKINPVKWVGYIERLLFAVLLFHIFLLYQNDNVSNTVSLSLLYLMMAIGSTDIAFKHMLKRIDALEETLNGQNQSQVHRREHIMKFNPIKWLCFILILLFGALLYNLFRLYQSREEGHFDTVLSMTLPLAYIVIAMSFIIFAFKYIQKRIDTLEEKLNEPGRLGKL